ncbi:MAG: hypothetical protein M1834_005394 [Cirrosporium novae-zelandiae]|nr:MAG: hypothetical protein M1834_005394 [Cirrosporium novae-zelandiae]
MGWADRSMPSRQANIAACVVMPVLSLLVLALRFWTRGRVVRNIGPDDWIMVASWLCFVAYCACAIATANNGAGLHLAELDMTKLPDALKYYLLTELTYIPALGLAKISAGVLLVRISIEKPYNRVLWALIIFTIVYNIPFFFVSLFQCDPVSAWWDYSAHATKCMNTNIILDILYVVSGFNIMTDLVFAILPALMIRKLKLQTSLKLAISGILGLVFLNSIAAIVRMLYIVDLSGNEDFLYPIVGIGTWSAVEIGVAIIAGSLATLKPLVSSWASRVGTYKSRSYEEPGPYSIRVWSSDHPVRAHGATDDDDDIELQESARKQAASDSTDFASVNADPSLASAETLPIGSYQKKMATPGHGRKNSSYLEMD